MRRWSDSQKLNLSYCVSNTFGADKAAVAQALALDADLAEAHAIAAMVIHDLDDYDLRPEAFRAAAPQDERDRALVMAPLFHAAGTNGVLASIWTAGCQVVLPAFDAARALDLAAAERVTVTLGVPTMLAALADLYPELAGPISGSLAGQAGAGAADLIGAERIAKVGVQFFERALLPELKKRPTPGVG